MRFIRRARCGQEQNITAFHICGHIYYKVKHLVKQLLRTQWSYLIYWAIEILWSKSEL